MFIQCNIVISEYTLDSVNRHRMLGLFGKISEKCGLDLCANDRQILPLILIY